MLPHHGGHIPVFATITDARAHESGFARGFELPKGSIVFFDRGYLSHVWFRELVLKKISLVTRPRRNAVYMLLERCPVARASRVTSDHIIEIAIREYRCDWPDGIPRPGKRRAL